MNNSTKGSACRSNEAEAEALEDPYMSENNIINNDNDNEAVETLTTTEDSCCNSKAKRPGRAVANASKKMKTGEEPIETHFTDLPDIVLLQITSFFGLKDLLCKVQCICRRMQRICHGDSRWLPVIAPPSLAHKVLKLEEDGAHLRRLYIEYCQWMDWWLDTEDQIEDHGQGDAHLRKLRSKVSDLDGFFSLSPWEYPATTYPTPWLHRMVYQSRCPTESDASSRTPPFRCGRRMVLRRRTTQSRDPPSLFFQQRRRTRSRDCRTFYTEPILPPDQQSDVGNKIRRVAIQPVNFLHDRLPDHDAEPLQRCMAVCNDVLECFFGPGTAIINPVVCQKVKARHCREDVQGLRDVDGRPVLQIHKNAVLDCPVSSGGINCDTSLEDASVVFLIAPHMYADTLAWCYSSSLVRNDHSDYPAADPWVVSTFQARQQNTEGEFSFVVAHMILSSVLKSFHTMGVCENLHCVLNNCDSMEEAAETFCFVPCCACIRKLQLAGVIGGGNNNVHEFLSRLRQVLDRKALAPYSQRDLAVLDALGYK